MTCHVGHVLDVLPTLEANSVDAVVTDPPYHLTTGKKGGTGPASVNLESPYGRARVTTGFMGMDWDGGDVALQPATWAAVFRVMKPGAYLLAFGGSRTSHRMVCAIEDAGFEIRDTIMWLYGSGFPKSLDVSKAIDKANGDPVAWRAFSRAYAGAVKASTFTHADIDRAIGIKSSSCYWGREDHRGGMPPRKHWEVVRELLGLPASFESLYLAAEREVVAAGVPRGKSRGVYGDFAEEQYNYTASATEAAREWQGWGTALKPAHEPICLARKPLTGTVAANVMEHGTGALNIDGCRVIGEGGRARDGEASQSTRYTENGGTNFAALPGPRGGSPDGRWPANIIHDGSEEVLRLFPSEAGAAAPVHRRGADKFRNSFGTFAGNVDEQGSTFHGDTGSAARFFYCAKASKADRSENGEVENKHPTVKPTALMRYLCRLVTPPGGVVLDPFMGSGSTGKAAALEGFRFIGIDREVEYVDLAQRRIAIAVEQARRDTAQGALAI